MTKDKNIQPFVKWAGGKRQLLDEIKKRLPLKYNNYFEPFLGGGAVLFDIKPDSGVLANDINKELIHCYKVIRDNPDELIKHLKLLDDLDCDKDCFYEYRERFNSKILAETFDIEKAALLIFLNKRCFNGLYRVNSKGLFNVPFNGKNKVSSFDEDNIRNISKFLKDKVLTNDDFAVSLKLANKGDFIFIDSPYAPLNDSTFESYTKLGFSKEEHIRLSELYKELDKKGCLVMLTNHNTPFIRELYKDFKIDEVSVKRMINRDAKNRVGEEVIITNYER